MTSSTRSLRRSPPRRPLHERSDSHANQRASRIINHPPDPIYKNTPYPTHPSHILSPKHGSTSGLVPEVFEGGSGIPSQEHPSSDFDYDFRTPQDKRRRDPIDLDDVENNYENSVRPLSIGNPKPIAVSPLNFNPPALSISNTGRMEESIDEEHSDSDEIVQLPSVFTFPGLPEQAAPESHDTSSQQRNDAKSSDLSLSSSESTGTILRHKIRPSRGSYSAFPPVSRPSSSKSGSSPTTPQRAFPSSSDDGSSISPASAGSATFSTPEIHQASAATISRQHRVISDPVNFQYPVVRQPSASSSRAESSNHPQNATVHQPQRTVARNQGRWNPHLSTVPSELTEDRSSDSNWFPSPAGVSPVSPNASHLSVAEHQRDPTASTIRMVNESDDNVSNLLSPIPGSRGSAYYSILSGGSRNKRKSVPHARPTSKGSFFRDSIPAWAKWYYARSNSALALHDGRQDANLTASSESLNVRRTRPKAKAHTQVQTNRDSLAIGPVPQDGTVPAQVQGEPRQPVSQLWSPHLWQDRRNVGRRNFFKAPSLDERAEGPFSRRNAQVLLFTFGYIFPLGKLYHCHVIKGMKARLPDLALAWFIASVLPLPRKPTADFPDLATEAQPTHDLEKRLGMVDEARYENARWWRNLNRLMCIVGVLIIAAIVGIPRPRTMST
ncbi:MAG: hypothetical protein LQ343_001626 [Gyalolechia ehrenbergii]|nr:MAG: hypothetical protein LQ343_001626 [Gyalolechia ehrenbergii]